MFVSLEIYDSTNRFRVESKSTMDLLGDNLSMTKVLSPLEKSQADMGHGNRRGTGLWPVQKIQKEVVPARVYCMKQGRTKYSLLANEKMNLQVLCRLRAEAKW